MVGMGLDHMAEVTFVRFLCFKFTLFFSRMLILELYLKIPHQIHDHLDFLLCFIQKILWGLPCGPVVKNPPSNAGDAGSIPSQGTKIPHAAGQLSPRAATTEPSCRNERSRMPQLRPDATKNKNK